MKPATVTFSKHAFERMFARSISPSVVRGIVETGETIRHYPDDQPSPSRLVLGFAGARPIHVVVAYDESIQAYHVVTAYEPDPTIWNNDWRTKRSS